MIKKTDKDEIQKYLTDESSYIGFCDAVLFPENEKDILDIIKECNLTKTRITSSGNGTGLTSGRVPEGGVVISFEKMNNVLELNEKEKYIIVQPGMILQDIQTLVESKSLFYPPDPTERSCFIGAAVVTNSSGARTFKYGPTRDYVIGLTVILPDGEIVKVDRDTIFSDGFTAHLITESGKNIPFEIPEYKMPDTKNAAGYYCKRNMDLIDLFIGSEGTLGVLSKIKLKLISLPKGILSCVAFFETENNAFNFIDEARNISKTKIGQDQINARGLEYFDNYSLRFLTENYPNIPETSNAAVWFEQEIFENEDELFSAWLDLMRVHNAMEEKSWFAVDQNEQEKLKEFRHAIAWKVGEVISQRGLKKVGTDVAVPVNDFRKYYFDIKAMIEKAGLNFIAYGHFGDSHMHLNFLPLNQDEYIKSRELYKEICLMAMRLNGTFSAEHGVGKSKRDFLVMMYGEDIIRKMAALKKVFDPNSILNIGNIFEEKYLND